MREVASARAAAACQTAMALAGAVVSKPTAKKTTCAVGVLARQLHRVERRVDHAHVAALRP